MSLHAIAAAGPTAPSTFLRSDLLPLLFSFVMLLALLTAWWRATRRPVPPPPARSGPAPTFVTLVRYVVIIAVGGYASFLVLVGAYYAAVARQTPWFLRQAVSGGAVIAFAVGVPILLLLAWVEARIRSR
jgi:Family of unknown function (DUF6256)